MKVFISGPMSGYDDYNREAFHEAEKLLKAAGYSVFNPAWLRVDDDWNIDDIMAIDMAALSRCDAIYQLDDWKNSNGAVAEYHTAKCLKMDILTKDDIVNSRRAVKNYENYLNGGRLRRLL